MRKRLSSEDRRESILAAATLVFAEHGFSGATTLDIAKAARVSEALLYRHFSSKQVLYRAVLRRLIEQQDANFRLISLPEPSTAGLVGILKSYLAGCVRNAPGSDASVGQKILFASLAGDSSYARLTYRRAHRLGINAMERALEAARAAGDMRGETIDASNAYFFIEHVGSMIMVARVGGKSVIPYAGNDAHLLRQAVWFCGRGLGLTDEAIARHFSPASAPERPQLKAGEAMRRLPRRRRGIAE